MTTAVQQYLLGHKSGSQRLVLIRWKCFFLLKLTVTNVRERRDELCRRDLKAESCARMRKPLQVRCFFKNVCVSGVNRG